MIWAQTSWTGTYRLTEANGAESKRATLYIEQLTPDQWAFTLQFSTQVVAVSGILTSTTNKTQGVFVTNQIDAEAPCSLIFQFTNNEIYLIQDGNGKNCGFDTELDATGTYYKYSDKIMR